MGAYHCCVPQWYGCVRRAWVVCVCGGGGGGGVVFVLHDLRGGVACMLTQRHCCRPVMNTAAAIAAAPTAAALDVCDLCCHTADTPVPLDIHWLVRGSCERGGVLSSGLWCGQVLCRAHSDKTAAA
jgi:hypothetical protein